MPVVARLIGLAQVRDDAVGALGYGVATAPVGAAVDEDPPARPVRSEGHLDEVVDRLTAPWAARTPDERDPQVGHRSGVEDGTRAERVGRLGHEPVERGLRVVTGPRRAGRVETAQVADE